jgi:hypothetical protein
MKSFKWSPSRTEETNCFQASLTREGKVVAAVHNQGTGGGNILSFVNNKEEKRFREFCASLEPDTYEEAGEVTSILMPPSGDQGTVEVTIGSTVYTVNYAIKGGAK